MCLLYEVLVAGVDRVTSDFRDLAAETISIIYLAGTYIMHNSWTSLIKSLRPQLDMNLVFFLYIYIYMYGITFTHRYLLDWVEGSVIF